MSFLSELFGTEKPIIGLVHIQPLPGDPFYKGEGMDAVIGRARADLEALQNGGID
ncbi:MAG: BtpA/SgcQ family protein, partial [Frisingicoccus sp.]